MKLIAPGERFALGWGPEAALRVYRETEEVNEDAGMMNNKILSKRLVRLQLSNIGADDIEVKVTERIPVSEIEQVEMTADAGKTTGGKTPDKNGFVEWDVRLAPFGRHSLRLAYNIKQSKEITGI